MVVQYRNGATRVCVRDVVEAIQYITLEPTE